MTAHPLSLQALRSTKTYCLEQVFTQTRTCIEISNTIGPCAPQVSSLELIQSRSLLGSSKEQDIQRRFVLSSDTVVTLAFNFVPHSLTFGALEVPPTRSVKWFVSRDQRRLSLQILLVDAATETFVSANKQDQDKEDENMVTQSLVDFQFKRNIIRFKLPCCFLDSRHRTGCYR